MTAGRIIELVNYEVIKRGKTGSLCTKSNQLQAILVCVPIEYKAFSVYKSSVFFNFLKIFGILRMEYTLIRAVYPQWVQVLLEVRE